MGQKINPIGFRLGISSGGRATAATGHALTQQIGTYVFVFN